MREIIGTKKVCRSGTGMSVYLDSDWGFRPGDIVQIKIRMLERGGARLADTGADDQEGD